MDMTESITPRSDQQNFDDYLTGSRTVTISGVTKGSADQPVNVELTEYPGRPFKPNKSMRRVLVVGWGTNSDAYVGRQLTLVGNPEVVYGGKAVGGIEIAAMSHIDKTLTVSLTATRGRRKQFTVEPLNAEPLKDESGRDWLKELAMAGDDLDAIGTLGAAATAAHANEKIIQMVRTKYADVKKGGTK